MDGTALTTKQRRALKRLGIPLQGVDAAAAAAAVLAAIRDNGGRQLTPGKLRHIVQGFKK